MIKGFFIKNIDGIKNASINNVKSIMVIAGPNGVGKSTLIEKLTLLTRGESLSGSPESRVEKTSVTRPIYFGPHRAPSPSRIHKSHPVTVPAGELVETLSSPNYGVSGSSSSLAPWLNYNYARNRMTPDFAAYFEVKNRLIRLKSKANEMIVKVFETQSMVPKDYLPNVYHPLKKFIKLFLPGISFKEIRIKNDYYEVIFTNRLNQEVEFDGLSSGEKDILAMFMPLIELEVNSLINDVTDKESKAEDLVFLIDGPEQHLHSSILVNLLNNLRQYVERAKKNNYNLQFILCTHSEILINSALKDELFLMMFPTEEGKNQLISGNELNDEDLKALFGDLGLVAITSGKKILLVEGPTDIDIINILYPRLSENLVLHPIGGKSGISNFIGIFQKLLGRFESWGITIYGLLDKDRKKIIVNCNKTVKERLFVLERTCLENYIVDSNSIYEALKVLAAPMLEKLKIYSAEEIINLIDEIIIGDNFFMDELETRLAEEISFHINIRNSQMDVKKIASLIDSVVESKKQKLVGTIEEQRNLIREIVNNKRYTDLNGKIIFGLIASKFGLDRETLVKVTADKLLKSGAIPPDLSALISKFNYSI